MGKAYPMHGIMSFGTEICWIRTAKEVNTVLTTVNTVITACMEVYAVV